MRTRRHSGVARQMRHPVEDFFSSPAMAFALIEYHLGSCLQAFVSGHPENDPRLRPWKIVKDTALLGVLAACYMQFYFAQVSQQIAALPAVSVLV